MHVISPRPQKISHDFECFSLADLPKCGASRYARDESTEVLMAAYAFDSEPIKQWVPAEDEELPAELEDAIGDDRIIKQAWNATFEWNIWKNVLDIDTPHRSWRDPMVLALSLSLPGKLEKVGPIIGLDERFLKKDGKALINWFCKLRPATKTKPAQRVHWFEKLEKWRQFLEYNRFDVAAERKIWNLLKKFDLPEHEWELYAIDQEINERGLPINMDMVENAVAVRDDITADRLEEMADITGLANPNSGAQLLPWLEDRGYPFNDLKAGHIRRAAAKYDEMCGGNWSEDYRRVLALRLEVSRAAPKKFDALKRHTDDDGRIRNTLQFAAAGRTWRWGGRGYQVQNLARPEKYLEDLTWETTPLGFKKVVGGTQIRAAEAIEVLGTEAIELLYEKPMDVLTACVRPVIQAPPGYVFIDADLNAIENRVLGWLADDKKILRVFEQDRDPYVDFATYMYKRSYQELINEVTAGDKSKRTVAKPAVLGCGYLLGPGKQYEDRQTGEIEATGLLGYAWNMGVRLTPEQAEHSVRVWRETFEDAVQFWWDIERAARRCISSRQETEIRYARFDYKKPFMRMILPSGRALHYLRPKLLDWLMPWGDYKVSITYEQLTEKHQWDRVSTHPGRLTENLDQSVARDLLAHGIRLARAEGLPTVLHVHDQIVALVKEKEADEKLRLLIDCMAEQPRWAKGLPMAADGHISKWFVKA